MIAPVRRARMYLQIALLYRGAELCTIVRTVQLRAPSSRLGPALVNPEYLMTPNPAPAWLANDPGTLDHGLLALRTVYQEMHIDAEWSVVEERRFRWWLKGHAQEITVSGPIESHGLQVFTLTASTPVVSGVALDEHTVKMMAGVNAQVTTLSAFTLEQDGIVRLVSRMTTHADLASWLPRHFALVAAMQAADAELIAGGLAGMLAGQPAESAHPESGVRPEYDDLINIIDGLIVPHGEQPSLWKGASIAEAHDILQQISLKSEADEDGVSAEFSYAGQPSVLLMDSTLRHPRVGAGLHVVLSLPSLPFEDGPYATAAVLNLLECTAPPTTDLQGGWCVVPDGTDNTVAFNAFFPNAFRQPGFAANLALWMRRKADFAALLAKAPRRT